MKMKKNMMVLLTAMILFSATACGKASPSEPTKIPSTETEDITEADENRVAETPIAEAPATENVTAEQPEVETTPEPEPTPEELIVSDPENFLIRTQDVAIDNEFVNNVIYDCEHTPDVQVIDYPSEVDGEPVTIVGGWSSFMVGSVTGNCKNVVKIIIPEGVTRIDQGVAPYCDKLEDVELPDSLTYIAAAAFISCPRLKELIIPDGVTIEAGAFEDCKNLVVTYEGEQYSIDNDPNGWWTDARD